MENNTCLTDLAKNTNNFICNCLKGQNYFCFNTFSNIFLMIQNFKRHFDLKTA